MPVSAQRNEYAGVGDDKQPLSPVLRQNVVPHDQAIGTGTDAAEWVIGDDPPRNSLKRGALFVVGRVIGRQPQQHHRQQSDDRKHAQRHDADDAADRDAMASDTEVHDYQGADREAQPCSARKRQYQGADAHPHQKRAPRLSRRLELLRTAASDSSGQDRHDIAAAFWVVLTVPPNRWKSSDRMTGHHVARQSELDPGQILGIVDETLHRQHDKEQTEHT